MKNRNLVHSDNWATPQHFYDKLNQEFNFDFDPCPYDIEEITPDKDGLLIEWGKVNYINPPYSRELKEAFVKKAIQESKKGKVCVMLLPVSTSTKLFHEHVQPNAKEIRFVERRVPFIGVNTKGEYVNWHLWDREAPEGVVHVRNAGMHDSMVVIFDGR